jgi:hypothetical protein
MPADAYMSAVDCLDASHKSNEQRCKHNFVIYTYCPVTIANQTLATHSIIEAIAWDDDYPGRAQRMLFYFYILHILL